MLQTLALPFLILAPVSPAPLPSPAGLTGPCPSGAQCARLAPYGSAAFDHFAGAVAISGDIAVFGARRSAVAGGESGAAYIYVRGGVGPDGWGEAAKLLPDSAADDADFGESVAIDGDVVVVGADGDDALGDFSGSAFVFERDALGFWNQTAKLVASDGAPFHRFGRSVSVSGDRILVGADGNDAAYVFARFGNLWSEVQRIQPPDATAAFGFSVSIDDDWALIGAWRDNDAGNDAGAAYVFRQTASPFGPFWSFHQKLSADDAGDGQSNAWFGSAVAVRGVDLAIGAYGYDSPGKANAGAAYVYRAVPQTYPNPPLWNFCTKLAPCVSATGDQFGRSVAVDGKIVVGMPLDDDAGSSSGSAYVFEGSGGFFGCKTWTLGNRLRASSSEADAGDQYGLAVAIDGASNVVVVGAEWDDAAGQDSGSAFVHTSGGSCTPNVGCGFSPYAANTTPVNAFQLHGEGGDSLGSVASIVATGANAANPPLAFNALYLGAAEAPFLGGLAVVDLTTKLNTPLDMPANVVGGEADWNLAIPDLPVLIGFAVYMQALIFDPNQAQGIALSNGLRLVVCP